MMLIIKYTVYIDEMRYISYNCIQRNGRAAI